MSSQGEQPAPTQPAPPGPPAPPRSRGMAPVAKWLIGGLVAVVVLAGIAFAAVNAFFAAAEDDAVRVIPKDAILYGNVFLEPSNGQKMAIRDLLEKFPNAGTPEEARDLIARLLDEAFSEAGVTYTEDIEPWLGKQMAFFFTSFGPEEPSGAALIHTEDQDSTEETIDKLQAADENVEVLEERSYEGVDYDFMSDDSAVGFVESFLVIGSEPGFKSVVDASQGESLADSERFTSATDRLTDDRLAILYLDGKSLLESSGLPTTALSGPLFAAVQEPVAAVAFARDDGVVLEASSRAPVGAASSLLGPLLGAADDPGLLPKLPSETWGALGAPAFGQTLRTVFEGLVDSGVPGLTPDILSQQLERQFGINIERDLLSWMGDLAAFVEGTDPRSVGGGVIIESTNEQASDVAVDKIRRLLAENGVPVRPSEFPEVTGFSIRDPGAPEAIHVIAEERVFVVYGEQATLDAFGTDPALGGTEGYELAVDALGEGFTPSAYFDIQRIIQLIETVSAARSDTVYQQDVKPNLDPLTHIVIGSKLDDDMLIQRVIIGAR
jgi:hypothetical protein